MVGGKAGRRESCLAGYTREGGIRVENKRFKEKEQKEKVIN